MYLTFLGGSGDEAGGLIAVDASRNVAIMGTTTSSDFPVTDATKRSSGSNDMAISAIDPSGSALILSTMFGGSGAEATQNAGGIAFDKSANIFVASDTTSSDLTATPGAFHAAYGGGTSDGFLAIFRPSATPHLNIARTWASMLRWASAAWQWTPAAMRILLALLPIREQASRR